MYTFLVFSGTRNRHQHAESTQTSDESLQTRKQQGTDAPCAKEKRLGEGLKTCNMQDTVVNHYPLVIAERSHLRHEKKKAGYQFFFILALQRIDYSGA